MSTQRIRSGLFVLVTLTLFLQTINTAHAGEERYTNIIVGVRPAGLGGAYTAISDETTGLYYNPAGVVFSGGKSLSVSSNGYYTSTTTYKNTIGGESWVRNSAALLPNFFGIVQPVGEGVFGFSYAVPDAISEDQDQVFLNPTTDLSQLTLNFNKDDRTYNFGPSYAREINRNFSIGFTLYYHTRTKQVINNIFRNYSDSTTQWQNTYQEVNELGWRPLLGLMFTPTEGKYSIGVAVSQTLLSSSDTIFQIASKGTDNSTAKARLLLDDKRIFPIKTSLGFAYFPNNSLLIAVDATYYTATDHVSGLATIEGTNVDVIVTSEVARRAVLNLSAGFEYYVSDTMAIRSGIFTDKTNNYSVGTQVGPDAADLSGENIDLYGLSMSVSNFSKGSSLTVGATYSSGKGSANKNISEEEATISSLLIFLGSSYAY